MYSQEENMIFNMGQPGIYEPVDASSFFKAASTPPEHVFVLTSVTRPMHFDEKLQEMVGPERWVWQMPGFEQRVMAQDYSDQYKHCGGGNQFHIQPMAWETFIEQSLIVRECEAMGREPPKLILRKD